MSLREKRWGHGLAEFGHGTNEYYDENLQDLIAESAADETAWAGPQCSDCGAPCPEIDTIVEGADALCQECFDNLPDYNDADEQDGHADDHDNCAACGELYFVDQQKSYNHICSACISDQS